MPEKKFGIRDIVPNIIRDNVPNTKNSYFQMSSTMSLIPKKKMSLIPSVLVGTLSLIPNSVTWVYFVPGKQLNYTKIDPGDLVPEEDSIDWTNVMVEGERNPDLLREYYQTTLKGM